MIGEKTYRCERSEIKAGDDIMHFLQAYRSFLSVDSLSNLIASGCLSDLTTCAISGNLKVFFCLGFMKIVASVFAWGIV
jgi:hypothetical protein